MGKIRVLVVDDGSPGGVADPGSALPLESVEVIGCLRMGPQATLMDLIPRSVIIPDPPGADPAVRETARCAGLPSPGAGGATGSVPAPSTRDMSEEAVYLTKTELDVLRLLAKGQRNKDIAREMYISVNTVKTHVASIFRKLRVKNRSQAVRYVYSRGIW